MATPKKPEPSRPSDTLLTRTGYHPITPIRDEGKLPGITVLTSSVAALESVSRWLQRAGYSLAWLNSDAVDPAGVVVQPPGVLLLHTFSPNHDLAQFTGMVRQRKTSVVVLTVREALGDLDFTAGFDDFLCAPYDPVEVEARIRFAVWRRHGMQIDDMVICGDLAVDLGNYEVRMRGETVDLTLKEYELLKYLVTRRGRVFTRERLLTEVWGYDYYGGTRTVDVHVRRLRMKLERSGVRYIQTVRGVGYKFGD